MHLQWTTVLSNLSLTQLYYKKKYYEQLLKPGVITVNSVYLSSIKPTINWYLVPVKYKLYVNVSMNNTVHSCLYMSSDTELLDMSISLCNRKQSKKSLQRNIMFVIDDYHD